MTSIIAIMIVAALFVAVIAPLVIAARKPRALTPVTGIYGVVIVAIAISQTGLFASPALPSLEDVPLGNAQLSDAQCRQLLTLLDDGGVIIDRRAPPRLVVVQGSWEQLPTQAREAVVTCVQRAWPRGAAPAQVEARPLG